MGRYIATRLTDKQIIINYVKEHRLEPKYYACPRRLFKEILCDRWIINEIMYEMGNKQNEEFTAEYILKSMYDEMYTYLKKSKTDRSKDLFYIACRRIEDCLELLRAKEE